MGIDEAILAARRAREQAELINIATLQNQLTTLADLHRWLYAEHAAYAVGKQPKLLTEDALATY
ncbi:MAG: hypothetical protein AAGH78_14495 [Cyanobacteria bacterium P01_H01_bin.58]